jgi:very-short-patch-repair endonuclease
MSFRTADAALRAIRPMARTAELVRHGVTEGELTRAVRDEQVIRVRQGVYALPGTDAGVLHAATHGGTLGCCAAGELLGLWILTVPDEHHVWLGRTGTPRSDCEVCFLHWDEGNARVGALPPVRNVLLQISQCCDEETFFAALESALRQALLSHSDLTWLRRRLRRDRRWLFDFARADADSGLESLFRLRMHRLGVAMRTQVSIHTVGEVDFVIGDRLIIEVDGRANHEGETARSKDLKRDAAAAALGYTTLRFSYAMIVHHWDLVEAAVLASIADGTHLRPLH